VETSKRPLGISFLIGFFWFGAAMCSLTVALLLFPGSPLDLAWRIKPTARSEFAQLGIVAIPLMMMVGAACALAAIGLAKGAEWGRRIAITVLAVNIIGDATNAVLRADWRTLIGLPIGGVMILYLMRSRMHRNLWR
jgi:hypothetical protein